jgi:hypothetical protein
MSRIHRPFALAMMVGLFVQQAWACSCIVFSICELVEKADVIFLGEVIDVGLDPGEDAVADERFSSSSQLRICGACGSSISGYLPEVCYNSI